MDPFDDFEMKPITEGLGFHKKKTEVRPEQRDKEEEQIDEFMSALDQVSNRLDKGFLETDYSPREESSKYNKYETSRRWEEARSSETRSQGRSANLNEDIEIVEALPRSADVTSHQRVSSLDIPLEPMPEIIPDVPAEQTPIRPSPKPRPYTNKSISQTGTRRGAADSPARMLSPIPFSLSSAFLDMLVVLAMSLLFLVSLLTVTGVNLDTVFKGLQKDFMTQFSMALLYVAVMQIYVILARSFFGKTLGEWTFDLQMGDDVQFKSSVYPLLILWRSFLTVITGVFILPLISLIVRKDISSYLTGLQLYKKR